MPLASTSKIRIMEYKDQKYTYLGGLIHGISTLATGMKTSIKVYFRKKVTEQYPENRKELKMFDRFRGTLAMPHNENNEHRCVACGLCQIACPNDTITVTSETIETEDGKKKKILAKYEYDLGVLSYEAVVCVDNVFVEDTPYGGAGEYSLHKNAAMLGVKALRLSRELRMLCGLPLHGLSDTLSPTRLVLLKARGKTLQKEYEMVKKSKKTEQEIEDFIKGTS